MTEQDPRVREFQAELKAIRVKRMLAKIVEERHTIANAPRLSATDLANLEVCERKLYLKYNGDRSEMLPLPPMQQVIQAQGVAHEQAVVDPSSFTRIQADNFEDGATKTLAAMRTGAAKIYQGILISDELLCRPDLLIRIDKPSNLGNYHYCPVEIKLGQTLKREHEIQLMTYLYLLQRIQGVETLGIIQLGDNSKHTITLSPEFDNWLRAAKAIASGQIEPPPFITSFCNRCVWRQHCRKIAQEKEDISLIPDITRQVRSSLHQEGITTLSVLARMEPNDLIHIKGVGDKTARTMIHRARAFITNEAIPFNRPVTPTEPVEVYFDVESIQIGGFSQEYLRYYLFGWCVRRGDALTFEFEYELAERPDQEIEIWKRFLERIDGIPGPVFHYSNYEKQTIKNLNYRYGADPRAKCLEERLVDLYPLVKNHIALPLKSYSIKAVAPWLGYRWTGTTQTAADTMIEYSRWLRTGNRTHLNNILVYNEHDCRAMVVIKDWLSEFNL